MSDWAKRQVTDEAYKEASENVVVYAYSTLVMALKEVTNMNDDDIKYIIGYSQHIWDTWQEKYGDADPITVCEEVTGIWIGNQKQAERLGVEE